MDLEQLITMGEGLRGQVPEAAAVILWEEECADWVQKQFGERYKTLFQQAAFPGYVPYDDQEALRAFSDARDNGIEFLKELRQRPGRQDDRSTMSSQSVSALHPKVQDRCSTLFAQGHYSEAVEAGFKVVRNRLRDLTSYEMATDAFGRGGLYIDGATAAHVDNDFQRGCKFMMMAIDSFRNEKAHVVDGDISDPTRAYEYLSMASLAMHHLDSARIKQN